METTWIDLRGEGDELHGRLNLVTLELMTGRRGRLVCYDLMATLRERRAVVVRVRASTSAADEAQEAPGRA